jgi:preprotein translocase subunit SecA
MFKFNKILGDPNARQLKKLEPLVEKINSLEADLEKLSDEQLKDKTQEFKNRLAKGETLDDILPEAFAVVRETAKRVLGMRHYDVQLIGGMILHRGEITEMRTGEGKTLVATLPLYLNALSGQGVHLVTVNDYLARRDATWMGKIYHALGMRVGIVQQQGVSYKYDPESGIKNHESSTEKQENNEENKEPEEAKSQIEEKDLKEVSRKEAYECDITYGTNNEFGFDYLRDNMAQTLDGQTQRQLYYAIVDEVDSILIDEARTPLIISAPATESQEMYHQFARIVPSLSEGEHYNVDEKMRAATLTDEGIHKVEKSLGVENLYAEGGIKQVHHLEQALKAHTLFKKDKEYVVQEGEVIIVDEFTGRLMQGRRYSDGLHQAIEAKEGVAIQQESVTMATITFQNLFRLYGKLAGMTGTAKTEEEEFAKIYGLPVMVVPTNKPIARQDLADRIYKNEQGKFEAVIKEIKEKQELGQPVLVGTVSIEKNEKLASMLDKAGVKYELLNAKDHEREAQVIAQAGRPGSVTIATNMAGRGVDIVLGGDPADKEMADAVKHLGGLHVIGTERHESRRIDNQLRGRSGRQGDPGSSAFFISTEDDLMRIFGSDRMKGVMERLGVPDDMPIENKIISKSIESAQKKVEGHNFDIRKHLVEYDDVINKHREVIYKMRQEILLVDSSAGSDDRLVSQSGTPPSPQAKGSDAAQVESSEPKNKTSSDATPDKSSEPQLILKEKILDMIEQEVSEVVSVHAQGENQENWNLDEIYEVVDTIFTVPLEVRLKLQDIEEKQKNIKTEKQKKSATNLAGQAALIEYLVDLSEQAYERWTDNLAASDAAQQSTESFVIKVEKAVILRSIDTLWVEHIDAMDHLRTGIGLRGYGQRDPLVEYKKEAFKMFASLQINIRKQLVYSVFKVGQPIRAAQQENLNLTGADKTMDKGQGQFSGVTATGPLPTQAQAGTGPRPPYNERGTAAERLAKKKEGVQDAPVTLSSSKGQKIGRNDPCPCGAVNPATGKIFKYKKCGMINAPHHKE